MKRGWIIVGYIVHTATDVLHLFTMHCTAVHEIGIHTISIQIFQWKLDTFDATRAFVLWPLIASFYTTNMVEIGQHGTFKFILHGKHRN